MDIDAQCREILTTGFCVLKKLLPEEVVWACARSFAPLLQAHVARADAPPNRGPARHFVPLPFKAPFAAPILYENDIILAIVERILGADMAIGTYATDTPLEGSVYQDVHSDISPLFPDLDFTPPPYVIAVNFPFVDVGPENGPFEVARGTHLLPREAALQRLEGGEIALEPLCLEIGDVLIRDPRCLHRGTPNRTPKARPVAVISLVRAWYRFVYIPSIPKIEYEKLSERARQLFRFIPVGN